MRKLFFLLLFSFVTISFAIGTDALAEYYSKSYALVIGIDRYPTPEWPDLDYARDDAEAVALFLKNQGFQVIGLYDKQANKNAIIEKMQNYLARIVRKNDRVLVFFAGHGYTEELAGEDWGYIVPYHTTAQTSAGYISMEKLQTLSRKMGKAKHQLFIMASCYGGLLGKTRGGGVAPNIQNYLAEVTKRKARLIITAGGKDQQVFDSGPKALSVFTGHLIEAIQDSLADTNGDGYITYSELASYLVPIASNAYQTPAHGTLPGHGLGEFVFSSPKRSTNSYTKPTEKPGSGLRGKSGDEILTVRSNINEPREILDKLKGYKVAIYVHKRRDDLAKVAKDIENNLYQYGFSGSFEIYKRSDIFYQTRTFAPEGFEIRYDYKTESDVAYALKSFLKYIYPSYDFKAIPVNTPTPNFISVFLGPN